MVCRQHLSAASARGGSSSASTPIRYGYLGRAAGRNLVWKLQDGEPPVKILLRNRDSRFSGGFDEVFRREGVEVICLPHRAPRANTFAERWWGQRRREAPDRPLIFGRHHPARVLDAFVLASM